jgi:hypothetical protein
VGFGLGLGWGLGRIEWSAGGWGCVCAAPATDVPRRPPTDAPPTPTPPPPPPSPPAPTRRLRYISTLHPVTALAALSPHVARRVSERLGGAHVHWMLPTPQADCSAGCAEGFAVQGK